jgi:hypothetical protein
MDSTVVREIRGAKINPKSSFKNHGSQNMRRRKLHEQTRYLMIGAVFLAQGSDSVFQEGFYYIGLDT